MTASRRNTRNLSTRDRLHQVKRYLIATYGIRVRLRVESLPKCYGGKNDCLGVIEYENPSLPPLIRVSKYLSKSESLSTLLHEYAHAISHIEHGPAWERKMEGHEKNKFGPIVQELENLMHYKDGFRESMEY